MAGVELHKKIVENTLSDGTDQSHLEVLHLSRSCDIVDRTEFLLGRVDQDPADGMFRTFRMAEAALHVSGKQAVGGIPCNTFHAPRIFNRFLQLLESEGIEITILNMIDETAKMIRQIAPEVSTIGLMSTTGTRQVGVYRQLLETKGMEVLEVPEVIQPELHDSIYNRKWGIKAVSPVSTRAKNNFEGYARGLAERGAGVIILGCTEIPLALPGADYEGILLVDPVLALARGLIRESNPRKLKALPHYSKQG